MTSKYEVAITGMSGRFPECEDVRTFRQKLYKGDTFITVDDRKWPVGYKHKFMSIPHGLGKYKDIEKLDRTVFKMNTLFAVSSDILNRKILEPSFEAMIDAGVNPYSLDGENIGVFISCGINDMDNKACKDDPNVLAMIGSSKTMMSNRISFAFNFTGPSFTCYSDILGGMDALAMGYKYVSDGTVDAAVVGTSSSILDPRISVPLFKMGLLSPDAKTRVFDASANGCARSESTIVFYLQKLEDAKRNYGTLNFCDTFFYGLNPSTLLAYDEDYLKISLKNIYEANTSVDKMSKVAYVEMNSYAVKRLETIETNVVAELFGKDKSEPLLIGSVKSNVGHTEGASGLMGIIKALFALDSGYVAPNMNFTHANDELVAIKENKLKVVDRKMELNGDTIAVNSIGLGGLVGHALITRNSKKLQENRKQEHLPRLLLICGRAEDELRNKINEIEKITYSPEFVVLSNEAFGSYMPLHVYRGYTILPKPFNAIHAVEERGDKNRPVWFVFSGMGSQWNTMGKGLLDMPIFAQVVEKCSKILRPKGIDIYEILLSDDPTIFDDIINAFVGIITVQIGLVEILKALDIKPDGIIGHSVGENACGYADGCLTLEQAVLSSYARGAASNEVETIKGMMAAIGKGYHQIRDSLPPNIAVACHNSLDNCTLTGPADDVNRFVKKLQSDGIFAKAVNVANIAYHSKYIAPAGPKLLARLEEVIPISKKRSPKWISTSVPESNWHTFEAAYCSAEYLTNNLLSPVLFEEGCKQIPENSIVIEIAPHGLLQAILKRSLPNTCTNISLTYRSKTKENCNYLLSSIGKLYIAGLEPNVNSLFPPIEYPVPRGTPAISPYCTWYHANEYTYSEYLHHQVESSLSSECLAISMKDDSEYGYLRHHKIDKDVVITPALFMYLTWWILTVRKNEKLGSSPVIFENLTFKRHVKISLKHSVLVSIMIHEGTGDFEVLLRNEKNEIDFEVILCGRIYTPEKKSNLESEYHEFHRLDRTISKEEFYRALEQIGYYLDGDFITLDSLSSNEKDIIGTIKWKNNWAIFLDSLIKFHTFSRINNETTSLIRPKYIRKLSINPAQFEFIDRDESIVCHHEIQTKIVRCKGVEMCDLTYEVRKRKSHTKNRITISGLKFVSYQNPSCQNYTEFAHLCLQIATENLITTTELILVDFTNRFTKLFADVIDANPTLKNNVSFVTKDEFKSNNRNGNVFLVVNSLNGLTICDYSNMFVMAVLRKDKRQIDSNIRNAFILVTEQIFDGSLFCLLKKRTLEIGQHVAVHVENHDKTVENNNTELDPTFVIKNDIEAEDLSRILSVPKSNTSTRYLYLADDEAGMRHLSEENLKNQLALDLAVAVSKNGEWGSYRSLKVQNDEYEEDAYSRDLNVTDIRMTSTQIHYMNTNNQRVKNHAEKNFGIEYSGIRDSKHRIMGLAWVESNKLSSKNDQHLTWNVPNDFGLEEAATIPLAYAQAYNIFIIMRGLGITKSTLINMGNENTLAIACITVALRKNYSIFVTVSNEEEKIALERTFPQLDAYRILRQENYHYETQVKTLTKGEGVNVVINCLRGIDHLTTSLRCVSKFGLYVEIGEHNCSDVHNLGLYPFLKSISFEVVKHEASTILKLPE